MSTFDLIDHDIEEYCEAHSSPESGLLYRLNRQTHLETINPRMLSGQLQGLFLTMVARMLHPRHVVEVGTFTGYSALCLAEGVASDGTLHTIEQNVEYEDRIRGYFSQSPLCNRIELHIGDARDIIPTLDCNWDLCFIDAEKEDYGTYYDLLLPRTRKGGFILVDNALWNGKVAGKVAHNDRDTHAILAFNDKVQSDPRVRNLLLPFRDGIMMIEKITDN
ncbi:MAG: O-methyltransferase [Bacteroidales bacterium]|nr:O-methyltransferase [Bacteroidales bacterium]